MSCVFGNTKFAGPFKGNFFGREILEPFKKKFRVRSPSLLLLLYECLRLMTVILLSLMSETVMLVWLDPVYEKTETSCGLCNRHTLHCKWLFPRATAHTLLNFHCLRVTISYQISWRILAQSPSQGISRVHFQGWPMPNLIRLLANLSWLIRKSAGQLSGWGANPGIVLN